MNAKKAVKKSKTIFFTCALVAAALLLFGIKAFIKSVESDAMRFSSEYTSVGVNNVYKYKTAEEVINTLKHGTGIIYLGFPSCPWCQSYTKMLNDLAKEKGIKEIYYYNIYDDREHGTAAYDELVGILGDYLQTNASGEKRIYVPNVTFVVDGEIIGNDYETSKDTLGLQKPDDYWTKERVSAWQEKISPLLDIFAKK